MSELKSVTEAEWPLLETLWGKSPLSAREVYEKLRLDRELHIQTVRTLLERMAKKEVLQREKVHGVYVFFPIVDRDQCIEEQSRSFLERFFGGKPAAVAAYFLRDATLPREELQRLQAILDAKMQDYEEEGSRGEQSDA